MTPGGSHSWRNGHSRIVRNRHKDNVAFVGSGELALIRKFNYRFLAQQIRYA